MLEIKRKIEGLIDPLLVSRGAFLVDVQVQNERGGKMVQLFVDTDRGITIEQCSEISRELLREFDERRLFDGNYRLEVSSPGIDRPLKLLRQYTKNIGRRFRVKYSSQGEQKTASLQLLSVVDEVVTFQSEDGEAMVIPFPQIVESREELPW